jgi:hypothetical protein
MGAAKMQPACRSFRVGTGPTWAGEIVKGEGWTPRLRREREGWTPRLRREREGWTGCARGGGEQAFGLRSWTFGEGERASPGLVNAPSARFRRRRFTCTYSGAAGSPFTISFVDESVLRATTDP